MKKIIILHEYGVPEHFRGLQKYCESHKREIQITYCEFRILKNIIKGIIHRDGRKILKNIKNIWIIISLMFYGGNIVVLGMAPYDGFVLAARQMQRKNKIVYYSSWPYWDHSRYPKHVWFLKKYIDRKWLSFLRDVRYVGVINEGVKNFVSVSKCAKSWVIPHSVDTQIYYPNSRRCDRSQIRVIYVGRLVQEKGIQYIIEAISTLKRSEEFLFTFIGSGDAKFETALFQLNAKNKNVEYKGRIKRQEAIANEYRNSDIILLPSIKTDRWEELFGMVLIEAMACGVVPVTTDCIGPKSIIKNDENGLIIRQKSAEEIVNALLKLKKENSLYKKLQMNAIETSKGYTIESCAEKWADVINDII